MHRIQVTFPYFSGLPSDVVQNTFHFKFFSSLPVTADFDTLRDDIEAFYTTIFDDTTTASVAPWIDLGAVNVKAYDLADPTPRTPVYDSTVTFGCTQAANSTIPPEVALCLSYQAVKVSGLPQARRRGRLFIGGLGQAVTAGNSSSFPVPTSNILGNMTAAATTLLSQTALDSWTWSVWSETNNAGVDVADGWVDNAFDTQRRRGNEASSRQTWS